MFETLDDAVFDGVAATYGAASEAPARLRALADGDPDALYWIQADYFHQDLFGEVTPLVVPYLLEVVPLPLAVQDEVVELLGRMLRGGTYAANDLAVYVAREDPRHRDALGGGVAPDAHEARTRRAIEAGRRVLAAVLDDDDPDVRRAAVWTYAAFGPEARPDLEARLAREPDPRVRTCAWLALSTLEPTNALAPARVAACSDDDLGGISELDVARVLSATELDAATERACLRLLGAPELPWLRFAEGRARAIVIHHLRRIGLVEPTAVPFLQRALAADDDPFGPLATFVREALFPAGVPRDARELTEAQRWAFRHIWVGEARGVRLPFGDLAGQRAFLDGDGPLDEVVTFRGHTDTVAALLLGQPGDAEALLAERARELPPARVFELATSITRGDLGYRVCWDAAVRTCGGSVTLERTVAYLAEPTQLTEADVALLLGPYLDPPLESPEALDPIALRWIAANRPTLRDWLRAFSPPHLAALVAQLRDVAALWPLCDRRLLGEALLARFAERGDEVLPWVSSSLLHERAPSFAADPRAELERELETRAARTQLALSARKIHVMELELMLPSGQRLAQLELDRLRTPADLEPLREVLRDHPNAALTVYDSVPAWIGDALGDRARPPE